MQAPPGMVLAMNAAPGAFAPAATPPYGPYAKALGEVIAQGGLSPNDVFEQVRLKVSQDTRGAQVPWHSSRVTTPFQFLAAAGATGAATLAAAQLNKMRTALLPELCLILGDGVDQAANFTSCTTSIPSLNFTPLMIFGN
jgi:uncharacterized caspase-like protein